MRLDFKISGRRFTVDGLSQVDIGAKIVTAVKDGKVLILAKLVHDGFELLFWMMTCDLTNIVGFELEGAKLLYKHIDEMSVSC